MRFLILFALLCSACGGSSSPTAPSTPITPITPTSYTVNGIVTATNGGQALSGLAVTLNGLPTTTNSGGGFAYTMTSGSTSRLTLEGAGIVPRALTLNVGAARSVAVGAIALSGAFDLNFYRQFVRDGFEQPTALQSLRRLQTSPRIYLKTVDEAGRPIDSTTLERITTIFSEMAPIWTAGHLNIAGFERGTDTRAGQAGWLTVVFDAEATTYCGESYVGLDGGQINFSPRTPGCSCPGSGIRLRTMRHELGHAFGFWHTGNAGDLMSGLPVSECDTPPSGRELAAAAIAYARPVGNVDPDSDPTSTVNLAPMRVR